MHPTIYIFRLSNPTYQSKPQSSAKSRIGIVGVRGTLNGTEGKHLIASLSQPLFFETARADRRRTTRLTPNRVRILSRTLSRIRQQQKPLTIIADSFSPDETSAIFSAAVLSAGPTSDLVYHMWRPIPKKKTRTLVVNHNAVWKISRIK